MQWFSTVAEAATSAVSTIQQTIEAEKKEFLEEYNTTVRGDEQPSKAAPSSSAAAESSSDSALSNLRRVGWAMLNPLEDQDSLKTEASGPSVVMLPWEAPGLSEPVRVRMRALSQEPAVFLSPPQAEDFSFEFKMENSLSLVLEALSVDKHLERQRHLLVPQQVSEFDFFRNYFAHLHALAQGAIPVSASASESGSSLSLVHPPTSDGGTASETLEVQPSASFSATPLEDQFECVANACLSEEALASAMASKVDSRREVTASPVASNPNRSESASPELPAPGTAGSGMVDASQLTSSWEEELKAELAAMEDN